MRTLLFASAAVLAFGGAAFAQNATGNPRSTTASNINGSDTRSELAPALPSPGVDMSPDQLLMRASQDLKAGRTGAAQEALEEAETRLLDRSTAPSQAGMPGSGPRVDAVRHALQALSSGDRHGAMQGIQMAMAHPAMQGGMGAPTMASAPGSGMSGGMAPGGMAPGGMAPAGSATMMPNGMNNNPNGMSGGSGNGAGAPAQ